MQKKDVDKQRIKNKENAINAIKSQEDANESGDKHQLIQNTQPTWVERGSGDASATNIRIPVKNKI